MGHLHKLSMSSLAICGALLLPSCSRPKVEPVKWKAIDLEELRDEIQSPTATLTPEVVDDVLAVLRRDGELRAAMSDLVELLLGGDDGQDSDGDSDGEDEPESDPPPREGELDGTNVYLRLACPGFDADNPVTDFSAGELRVDSPALTNEVLSTVDVRGDALVRIRDCETSSGSVISARMPTYYQQYPVRGIAVRAEDLSVENGDESLTWTLAVVDTSEDITWLLYSEWGSVAAGWSYANEDIVWIRGSDLELSCDFSAPTPNCTSTSTPGEPGRRERWWDAISATP